MIVFTHIAWERHRILSDIPSKIRIVAMFSFNDFQKYLVENLKANVGSVCLCNKFQTRS